MKKISIHIIYFFVFMILSSCEDNLDSPSVNPDIFSNKKVMLEVFSSITCVNCVQVNLFCDNIASLNGITVNDTNVFIINYHPSFFPVDPFFQFNRELNIEREQFYDISFIPSGFSDGAQLLSSFSASEWKNQINANLIEFNEGVISMVNTVDTITRSGTLIVKSESRNQYQINNLKLFLIITESNIYYNAPVGNKYYNNIARQMINPSGGEPIQILPGQTTTLIENYIIKSGIVIQNSAIIAFIQDFDSKKIIAVDKIKLY